MSISPALSVLFRRCSNLFQTLEQLFLFKIKELAPFVPCSTFFKKGTLGPQGFFVRAGILQVSLTLTNTSPGNRPIWQKRGTRYFLLFNNIIYIISLYIKQRLTYSHSTFYTPILDAIKNSQNWNIWNNFWNNFAMPCGPGLLRVRYRSSASRTAPYESLSPARSACPELWLHPCKLLRAHPCARRS